ncbi:unnamed protein product [Cuscuta epithymum]|uniref:Retrotransposon Copia-like N-terminal domain-containing protein n=1 Tax=Cuscuta epithymum TaxID=186058 RepID=A0AAV0CKS6_9ASTE|nr:unnamed protein product [Cuscuta epithymum]
MAEEDPSSEDEINPTSFLHEPQHSTYDFESPYHLLSSDNPGVSLVGSPLTGLENYSSWALAMTVALKGRNKFCFVDGSLPAPLAGHRDHSRWQRINNMVMSWMLHSVHSSLALLFFMPPPRLLFGPTSKTDIPQPMVPEFMNLSALLLLSINGTILFPFITINCPDYGKNSTSLILHRNALALPGRPISIKLNVAV